MRLNPIGGRDIVTGLEVLAAGAAVGGVLGAVINKPCSGDNGQPASMGELLCGPRAGAVVGAAEGVAVAVLGSVVVALLSKTYRRTALSAAGVGGALMAVGFAVNHVHPPATAAPTAFPETT